jgi:hypothetical protein
MSKSARQAAIVMPKRHRLAKLDGLEYPGIENKCPIKLGKKVFRWENYYPILVGNLCPKDRNPRLFVTGTISSWRTSRERTHSERIAVPAIRGLESALQLGDARFDTFAVKSE